MLQEFMKSKNGKKEFRIISLFSPTHHARFLRAGEFSQGGLVQSSADADWGA
jgi:hypothetical protein